MNIKIILVLISLCISSLVVYAALPPVFTDPWHTADELTNQTFACCNFIFPATTAFSYVNLLALTQINNTVSTTNPGYILLNSNVTVSGDYITYGPLYGQSPRIIRKQGGGIWEPWMAPGIFSNETGKDLYISTNNGSIQFLPASTFGGESTTIFPNGSIRIGYLSTGKNISVEKKLTLRLGLITQSKHILNSTVLCKKPDKSLGVCQNITVTAAGSNCTCI